MGAHSVKQDTGRQLNDYGSTETHPAVNMAGSQCTAAFRNSNETAETAKVNRMPHGEAISVIDSNQDQECPETALLPPHDSIEESAISSKPQLNNEAAQL